MPKLTKPTVDSATPDRLRDRFLWDTELKGFGLRVKPSGAKTFLLQYRNAAGQSKRVSLGQHGVLTCDAARKAAKSELAKATLGADPAQARKEARAAWTVKDLAKHYLAQIEAGAILTRRGIEKAASTVATDKGRIVRHILPLLGSKSVCELTAKDVRAFYAGVKGGKTAVDVRTGNLRGRAIVEGGAGTAKRTVGLLSGMLTEAVRQGQIATNPAHGLNLGRYKRREVTDPEGLHSALGRAIRLAEANGECWQATGCLRLIVLTGFRLGEARDLSWAECDLKRRAFRLAATKTGASTRPMSRAAADLLATLKARSDGGDRVFPSPRGTGAVYGSMPAAVARIIGAKGLDADDLQTLSSFTPHLARHAAATTGDALGLTLPTLGAILGHAAGGTTAGYIGRIDAVLIAAADQLAQAIVANIGEAITA